MATPLENYAPKAQYKYLTLIAMVLATIMSAGNVITYKIVHIGPFDILAGSFLTPTWFVIGDIITEVYGYKACQRLTWYAILSCAIFSVICYLFIQLPSPTGWTHQAAYDYIVGKFPQIVASMILGIWISSAFNSHLLAKWKLLTHGKYFWFRSITSSMAGELVFTIISMLIVGMGNMPFTQILELLIASYILKLVIVTLLAYPSTVITGFLKKREGIDVYDYSVEINPFKLIRRKASAVYKRRLLFSNPLNKTIH